MPEAQGKNTTKKKHYREQIQRTGKAFYRLAYMPRTDLPFYCEIVLNRQAEETL